MNHLPRYFLNHSDDFRNQTAWEVLVPDVREQR